VLVIPQVLADLPFQGGLQHLHGLIVEAVTCIVTCARLDSNQRLSGNTEEPCGTDIRSDLQ